MFKRRRARSASDAAISESRRELARVQRRWPDIDRVSKRLDAVSQYDHLDELAWAAIGGRGSASGGH